MSWEREGVTEGRGSVMETFIKEVSVWMGLYHSFGQVLGSKCSCMHSYLFQIVLPLMNVLSLAVRGGVVPCLL